MHTVCVHMFFLCTRVYIDVVVAWATWMTSPWNVYPCCFHVLETLNFVSVQSPMTDWCGFVDTIGGMADCGALYWITPAILLTRQWWR